jgi:hypothetical protein
MRKQIFVTSILIASLALSAPAVAQVSDAERAAARELFKEGDELQRAGKFADALEKFQRAERAYDAPTNVLRIAECQAALGRLVESAETYRSVLRTQLAPNSPQAFQAAVDQAKAELAQVEPRVPKLMVQVLPASANAQLRIDGQGVTAALIGEPIPLDPGTHRVRIVAQGFNPSEQDAVLKERETTTLTLNLRPLVAPTLTAPLPALPALPPSPSSSASPPPAAPAPTPAAHASIPSPAPALSNPPPPPPAPPPPPPGPPPPPPDSGQPPLQAPHRPSRTGLLLGGHIGWMYGGGQLPLPDGTPVDTNTVASGGVGYGLDGGVRLARNWYLGVSIEHAELAHGDLSATPDVLDASASTTFLSAVVGFIGNPDQVSFYGELGVGARWFSFSETTSTAQQSVSLSTADLTVGAGIWLPLGRFVRLLPKLTVSFGSFDQGVDTEAQTHSFILLGMAGFYNLDL